MKKLFWFVLVLVIAGIIAYPFLSPAPKKDRFTSGSKGSQYTITMSGAFALYPMAVKWAQEYQKIHPEIAFDIQAGGAGKGMTDVLSGAVDIAKISREIKKEEVKKGAYFVAVCKDAVVATVSEKNPVLAKLLKRGVKKNEFKDIWITAKLNDWGKLVGKTAIAPVNTYTRSDACGAGETWAKYLGGKQEDLKGVGVYGDPGVTEAVKRDVDGIGYNNINYAYDAKTKAPIAGIKIMPLDVNGNGKIDAKENFYASENDLTKAIADGRYPSPPARDLYLVTKGKPKDAVKKFLSWVLTDGQKFVPETGYIKLPKAKLQKNLTKLK